MEIPTIIIYTPSDNRNRVRLLDGDMPLDLSEVTKIAIKFDSHVIDSVTYPTVFRWGNITGIPKGVVELYLGRVIWTDAVNTTEFIIYDELYDDGLFMGFLRIRWIEDC